MAPSPSGSIVSLPPLVPLPTDGRSVSVSGTKERDSGFIGRWIRGSRGSEVDLTRTKVIQEEMVRIRSKGSGDSQPGYEDDEMDDEEYLTLDDI